MYPSMINALMHVRCRRRLNLDSGLFSAEDFVVAKLSGENQGNDIDNQRILIVSVDVIKTAVYDEVATTTSEIASTSSRPSTSGPSIRRA